MIRNNIVSGRLPIPCPLELQPDYPEKHATQSSANNPESP